MKKSNFIKVMMLASILPLSASMDDGLTNPTQEQVIELTNDNDIIQKRVSGGNVNINTGGLMDMTFGSIQ